MKTTKEEILMTSLRLFAERGFDAVSTSMIASELGITKGALYRHYESKQAVFDAIIDRMFELDREQAEGSDVPAGEYKDDEEAYKNTSFGDLCRFVNEQFSFWTENGFAMYFRRMITIEQFKDPERNRLYQDVIAIGPVRYTEDLFREMIAGGQLNEDAERIGARDLAVMLFAPLQLSIQLFDGGADPDELKEHLRSITEDFERRFLKENIDENNA